MASFTRKNRNPELEIIRDSVPGPPNIDPVIEELIRKTRDIDVSFLFGPEGIRVLKEICLSLSSVKDHILHFGWETFGHKLGLEPDVVKVCGCCYNGQDPTYNIFVAYSVKENATISRVLEALKPRKDILNKTCDLLNSLADTVHQKYGNSEESGYLSISQGQSSSECSEDDIQPAIIKFPFGPNVPVIFNEFKLIKTSDAESTSLRYPPREEEQRLMASPSVEREVQQKPKYGCTVMLTFASDGAREAVEIAKIMRRIRDGLPRLGVLILQDHVERFSQDPQQFIAGFFHKVDYVIPIITKQYLKSATSVEQSTESNIDCIDANYVRYIYTLMNAHFVCNGCLNNKVRCIIPDKLVKLLLKHPLMIGPLFQTWVKVSETESLSVKLLQSVMKRKAA